MTFDLRRLSDPEFFAESRMAAHSDHRWFRDAAEAARGGVSLGVPEQEVTVAGGSWALVYRTNLPCEGWNAQLSLLTGMVAADMMLKAGVGILRTLPPAEDHAINRLRRTAQGLGISWPQKVSYPDFVRGLKASVPREAAMLNACTTLFRGAGYAVFDGAPPEQPREPRGTPPRTACDARPHREPVLRFHSASLPWEIPSSWTKPMPSTGRYQHCYRCTRPKWGAFTAEPQSFLVCRNSAHPLLLLSPGPLP